MLQQQLEERIRTLFDYWDSDSNGLIDRDEFRLVMQVLAIPGTKTEYDSTFDRWDRDGNGGLNYKEVRSALIDLQQAHPELMDSAALTVALLNE